MSQMVTRKGPVGEDKEKRQTDSPVKDMKKKIAANAEKEKQAGEKVPEKPANDKNADKSIDKDKKDAKTAEKTDKKDAKSVEKTDKKDAKIVEKTDKKETKNAEKVEKKDAKTPERSDKKEKDKSVEKTDKKDKTTDKNKPDKSPEKKDKADKKEDKKDEVKEINGKVDAKDAKQNGARNGDRDASSDDDELERDELFPELAYDDSDVEVVDNLPSRSTTRRDQSKEKVLKLQDSLATDRKLRSADSPKPATAEQPDKMELDEMEGEARKPDTNYSRSRARVSPYRRAPPTAAAPPSADVTACSAVADYTGNNTTMETDMELSVSESASSPYLSGLRTIRGRRSYKLLKEMTPRPPRAPRPALAAEPPTVRPTAPVVGRKRRPDDIEVAVDALADTKRPRLLQRLARPFRVLTARQPEIVGINTDLPLTAPVACAVDPEVLKPDDTDTVDQTDRGQADRDQTDKDHKDQISVPTSRLVSQDKRCVVM